ncbi:hypothetical protein LAZ67_2006860, partial [Cordylochernes scorpioides]
MSRPLRVLQVNAKKSPTVILEIANLANSTQADIVLLQELSTNFFWPTRGFQAFIFVPGAYIPSGIVECSNLHPIPLTSPDTAITSIAICLEQSIIVVHSAYWHGLRAADDFIPLLEDTIRRASLPVILGMDTNAHSPTWGIGARLDFRGANLEEFASFNDLHFLGPPVDSTWSNGPLSSSIDVTLASSSLAIHVTRGLSDEMAFTDHIPIWTTFLDMVNNETKSSWVESSCKEQTFKSFLNSSLHQASSPEDIDRVVLLLTSILQSACDSSMGRRSNTTRPSKPWWTPELSRIRRPHPQRNAIFAHSDEPEFKPWEVLRAIHRCGKRKAPGPDGLGSKCLDLGGPSLQFLLAELFTKCLRMGHFPRQWKEGRLILLPKPSNSATSQLEKYRPITLLNTMAKVFERCILARLQRLADRHGWFFEDQYKTVLGTVNGRSAEDALASITQLIEERQAHWRKTLVISSDISKAFDTVWRQAIIQNLERLNCSESITCLVKSFLEDRTVSYSAWTATECTSSQLGTPQGSALSPFLWNIVARTIFTLPSIKDSRLIAYADDFTLMTQVSYGVPEGNFESRPGPAFSSYPPDRRQLSFSLNIEEITTPIIFTDESKNEAGVGAAIVPSSEDQQPVLLRLHPDCTAFQAELLAIRWAVRLVKEESSTEALRAFRNFKGIRRGKGPMSCYSLRRMIKNFEKTGSLEAKPRSGRPSTRKSVAVTVSQNVEAIETLSTYGERMPGHRKRRQFKQTDAFTRGMVIGLKRAGWSIRQIAANTHLGASTVHRLWRRWLEQENVAIYRNAGATRVTSARVDRRILRQAVAAPQSTCTAILQHVQDTLDHSISTRTISSRLVANGLHSCRPLRRLPLTPPNRRQRLEWCRARSTWMTEWHRVVFSDESRFCLSSDSRRVRVWRRRGERSNPAAIVERPTVRQRGIMVWGAIAYDSRSPLLRIQGTMTAQRYVDDVQRPVTLPYLQGVPNALYQQDNDRPHTARISQQALQDVQMLPWPPYSPDLSPIEHVWDIIGRRLHALPQPHSEDELWQMVEREWRAIPQDAIRTLIDSLPRRVAACIAVRVMKSNREFENRAAIIVALRAGRSPKEIVDFLKLPKTTIYRVKKQFDEADSNKEGIATRKKHSRRSDRVRGEEFVKNVKEKIDGNPGKSMRAIAKEMDVGSMTIVRTIHEDLGLKSYALRKGQLLTENMKNNRKGKAAALLNNLKHDSFGMLRFFSDEKNFDVDQKVNPRNDRLICKDPSEIPVVIHTKFPASVMVLGIISSEGDVMPPHFFEKGLRMNADTYINVLETVVKPWMDMVATGRKYVFQQDSAPAHKAKKTQSWLTLNVPSHWGPDIWPPNSPDCNPLDYYVWGVVERDVNKAPHTTIQSVKKAVHTVMTQMDKVIVAKACASFRTRLETVVANNRMPGHRKRRQFKQTDVFTRGMVIGLKRAGWSIRQIAADTHLGASTVHRLWRRWLEQGNVAIYRNVGATRVTSGRVDRRILRQAVAAPQATCTAILQHVQDTLDHSISTRTISRRLVANGLHSCRPLRRLPLTPPNRRQRLEWCQARSTWMTEWHRVVFSDESRFCLSSDSRRVRVWRRRGERSNPAAIVERLTVRQRGIMVWGAIAYDSRSPLLHIQGTMTAKRYVDDVLRPVTLPYLQGVPNSLYQQDNARPHTALISQQVLQDVQKLPWPPYSPDLSPIEHVWDIIGRRLHALPQPRSEDELWQMVEREWRAIPQDAIRTLIDSIPKPVAACIAVR